MIRSLRDQQKFILWKSWIGRMAALAGLLILSACSAISPSTPTPEPEPEVVANPIVSSTGIVLPARSATLSMDQPGTIEVILVEEGNPVQAGDLLLRLDGQVSREALEANVEGAKLEQISARMALKDLNDNNTLQATQAQLTLANAQDALDDAEYKWQVRQEGYRASSDTIAAAQANLVLANQEVDRAQSAFNKVSGKADDDPTRALALSNLVAAKSRRDAVERNLNWYTGSPTDTDQAILDAEVALAQAQLEDAQQKWETLQNGPDPDDVMLLEARIANAEAQLAAAESALADLEPNLELRAPFDGTVTEIYPNVGEWVNPGQPVLLLADLDHLQIETTDLSELDVSRIAVGEAATVTFDALPDVVVPATITRIADKASEGTGVNYTVILVPDQLPGAVRWGMTAFVDVPLDS